VKHEAARTFDLWLPKSAISMANADSHCPEKDPKDLQQIVVDVDLRIGDSR
jgi:hypothetical protein